MYKEVYQGTSGLVAREVNYTPSQFSALEMDLMSRRDDGGHRADAGPYNSTFLEMAFHSDIYSLGETTKTLQKNYEPVPMGSKEYNEVVKNMTEARQSINFDSCFGNASTKGLWVNLDKKDQ
jgi:hypothetical protein